MCNKIWPRGKIGRGQPKVIIWTNYDRPKSHMLHTKLQDNQPIDSTEEDF